jgi:hypothetical protein
MIQATDTVNVLHSNTTTATTPRARTGGKEMDPMDHQEATAMMATERYLLGEMTPELRDAFEEHLFDCPECALDTRAAAAFIDHAKVLLPTMVQQAAPAAQPAKLPGSPSGGISGKLAAWWSRLTRPLILVPAFATLLAVISYQNLVTYPALQTAASEPRLGIGTELRSLTRAANHPIVVSPGQQATLVLHIPQEVLYTSYTFTLYDGQGKSVWSQTAPTPANPDDAWSLSFPSGKLTSGTYKLDIAGVTSAGKTLPIEERTFDLQVIR